VDYGYAIGYSYKKDSKGYFMVKSDEQKELALRSIKRHIEGSMKRYEALKKMDI
ncbi:pathogenicity island protein, partial [Staphylococcus epidermidis]|nr:pathogenicity island protein [Staphylococcus epidermidis]MDS3934264.1 pathogenicity island protein [Staphylococcus epidermidis]